jgi:hypothetical protein
MKFNHYLTYTAIDFSTDPYFLEWRWFQTEETNCFWNEFLFEYPNKSEEVSFAIKIVESVIDNNVVEFSKEEKENAIYRLTLKIQRYKRRKILTIYTLSTVVVLTSLVFFLFKNTTYISVTDEVTIVDIPERDIQLILPTGDRTFFKEDIQLKYDETGNIIVQNEAGDMLDELESNNTHIDLNKLVVPKGKRSSLLLADGSIIWINSGTTVEFPSTFRGMDKRKIKVDGEIYIEVEKDTLRPFLVETPRFDVSVLGTKFNVMAYSEDQVQHVTVAEGLVSVYAENENQKEFVGINQQLSMSKNETTLKEVDVYNYISWKDGVLRFESEPLRNILERLSRYYDIQLNYESDIETIRCSGKLYLFDEWQLVFDNITKVTPVKYSIKNNEVTFKYISNK